MPPSDFAALRKLGRASAHFKGLKYILMDGQGLNDAEAYESIRRQAIRRAYRMICGCDHPRDELLASNVPKWMI